MMSSESLLAYFVTWFLVALTPGPAVIYVMSQAARYGLQAGFRGFLAFSSAIISFSFASHLACLHFSTTTHAFFMVQFAGAVHLLYLGLRLIISSLRRSVNALARFGSLAERRKLVVQAARN
jgi:threonine/homoserine/homoserine lactone efflux protein